MPWLGKLQQNKRPHQLHQMHQQESPDPNSPIAEVDCPRAHFASAATKTRCARGNAWEVGSQRHW
jgi:hypothetical protein